MDIKVFSPEEFDKIEYAWKKLENGADMTAFQLYDWYKNINDLLPKERIKNLVSECIYVLVEENGEPVMIAPLQMLKINLGHKQLGLPRAFYFIGSGNWNICVINLENLSQKQVTWIRYILSFCLQKILK